MKKTTLLAILMAVLMLFAGCGSQAPDQTKELKAFIDGALPAEYPQSPLYHVNISANGDVYTAEVLLDLSQDPTSIADFTDEDYMLLAEMESDYLLTEHLIQPPVDTTFRLVFHYTDDAEVIVEKAFGENQGTLTYNGHSSEIEFSQS